jgi:apolipoprotein D and lipocalin family protein
LRYLITLTLFVFSLPAFAVDTVQSLDVNQYMGFWHQVGAIPQQFAADCVRHQSAEYRLLEDNTIEVLNSCELEDGSVEVAEGRARINPDFNSPAKLQVTFVSLLNSWLWALSGDYWVIDLDPTYQWSLVGHPELSGLYILSREPKLAPEVLANLRDTVETVGYDSCTIIMTATPGGAFIGGERLCDLEL